MKRPLRRLPDKGKRNEWESRWKEEIFFPRDFRLKSYQSKKKKHTDFTSRILKTITSQLENFYSPIHYLLTLLSVFYFFPIRNTTLTHTHIYLPDLIYISVHLIRCQENSTSVLPISNQVFAHIFSPPIFPPCFPHSAEKLYPGIWNIHEYSGQIILGHTAPAFS